MIFVKGKRAGVRLILLILVLGLIMAVLRCKDVTIHHYAQRLSSQQEGYWDYEGVIHWHTRYSGDALGTYERIAELGNFYHVDFLVTTEHNNLMALKDHREGWHGHTLISVGMESSRHEGYLLGLNFSKFTTRNASTDAFISEVTSQGGMVIIAHPKNRRWHWKGGIDPRMTGQEVVDLMDQFTSASWLSLLEGVILYPFNSSGAYLQIYHRPVETLKMWDEVTSHRPFVGIYAPDTHQAIIIFKRYKLPFPKPDDLFSLAHDHVILTAPFSGDFTQDKSTLFSAIGHGHVYMAVDALQDATGFFYWARQAGHTAWMGDQLSAGQAAAFSVVLPPQLELKNTVINVYHNGQLLASSRGPAYTFQARMPGAYRVEVEVDIPSFLGFNRKVVWIYSNPIYLD